MQIITGDDAAHHVQVERVARYIWQTEGGTEEDWSRHLTAYRDRARRVMTEPPRDVPTPGARFRSRLTNSVVEIDKLGPAEPGGHDGVEFHYVEVGPRDARANVQVGAVAWFAAPAFAEAFEVRDVPAEPRLNLARYIIVLDRMDDDEAVGPDGHWPDTDEEGMAQVAAELQEAMDTTGSPAGFFRVVARIEVASADEADAIHTCPAEEAHTRARVAILGTTTS